MLDELSESILNFAVNTAKSTSHFFSINSEFDCEAETAFHVLAESAQASKTDICEAIKFLNEKGLVEYRVLRFKNGELKIAFHLTHEGLHFKELKSLEVRERWKERIFGFLSGVLVTVVAGLILAWLSK